MSTEPGRPFLDKAAIMVGMTKAANLVRSKMSLDMLFYHLHKARDNWAFMNSSAVGQAYKNTLVWKIAQSLPEKYENQIRARNAELCFQQRQDTFRKAGLL